jgi:hypothetical protein
VRQDLRNHLKGTQRRFFDLTGLEIFFEVNVPFDVVLDHQLCTISDHFQNDYSYYVKLSKIDKSSHSNQDEITQNYDLF